jgi:hypothetical protein
VPVAASYPDASLLSSVMTASGKPLPPILKAITHAAHLLYHQQLAQQFGSAAAGESAGGQQGVLEAAAAAGDAVDPMVAAAVAAGAAAQQQEMEHAWQLLQEVQVWVGAGAEVGTAIGRM